MMKPSRPKGAASATSPECRSSHLTRRRRRRRQHGTVAERMSEARATLERGPVVVFAHLTPVTSREGLDMLVVGNEATREERLELDLAAFARGEYTMRRVTVYRLKT